MLFSGIPDGVAFVADDWNSRTATIVASATIAAANANRAAVLPRPVIEARIACNFLLSSRALAGRAAGSTDSIDASNEINRWGTRAALSCSTGKGLDRRAS